MKHTKNRRIRRMAGEKRLGKGGGSESVRGA